MLARIWWLWILLFLATCSPAQLFQSGLVRVRGLPAVQPPTPANFRTVVDNPLTGGSSRFDYQSLDAQAHRTVPAALGPC